MKVSSLGKAVHEPVCKARQLQSPFQDGQMPPGQVASGELSLESGQPPGVPPVQALCWVLTQALLQAPEQAPWEVMNQLSADEETQAQGDRERAGGVGLVVEGRAPAPQPTPLCAASPPGLLLPCYLAAHTLPPPRLPVYQRGHTMGDVAGRMAHLLPHCREESRMGWPLRGWCCRETQEDPDAAQACPAQDRSRAAQCKAGTGHTFPAAVSLHPALQGVLDEGGKGRFPDFHSAHCPRPKAVGKHRPAPVIRLWTKAQRRLLPWRSPGPARVQESRPLIAVSQGMATAPRAIARPCTSFAELCPPKKLIARTWLNSRERQKRLKAHLQAMVGGTLDTVALPAKGPTANACCMAGAEGRTWMWGRGPRKGLEGTRACSTLPAGIPGL